MNKRAFAMAGGFFLCVVLSLPAIAQVYSSPNNVAVSSLPALNADTGALVSLSAAGAGTTVSADQTNKYARSLKCVTDVTVAGGTPTLVVTIQGKDSGSGKYYTLLASAALATVSTNLLAVGPGLTAGANLIANDVLPYTWRLSAVVGGVSPAVTATIGCSMTQ